MLYKLSGVGFLYFKGPLTQALTADFFAPSLQRTLYKTIVNKTEHYTCNLYLRKGEIEGVG